GIREFHVTGVQTCALPILQDNTVTSDLENAQMKRKYPLKIIMDLNGPLLSPDIAFDFDFSNFPEGELQIPISAFKNRIANDEQRSEERRVGKEGRTG